MISLGNHPDRNDQNTVLQTNPVPGTQGKCIPQLGKCRLRQIDRLAPADPVVITISTQDPATINAVILAIQKVDPSVPILYHHRIVDRRMFLRPVRKIDGSFETCPIIN